MSTYCTETRDDDYAMPLACFLSRGHVGGCAFTRFAALPAGHPLHEEPRPRVHLRLVR